MFESPLLSRRSVLLGALLLSTTAGCGTAPGDPTTQAPQGVDLARSPLARSVAPNTSQVPALGANNAAFAFDLYRGIAAENAGKNLVFSPYSISTALAMTYEGARGTTASEMQSTLHFELDRPALHEAFNATALALASRGAGKGGADGTSFRLNVNNSIWAQHGYPVVPAFLDVLAVNYGAGVFLADFARDAEGSRKAINGWIADKTEQLIPELLAPGTIGADTTFVLTNTVYFNAGWQEKFEKSGTHDAPFSKLDGSKVSSKMMSAGLGIPYAQGDNYRAIALPYEDDQLRFVAILPADGALDMLESKLSGAWFATLNTQWKSIGVQVDLPQLDYQQQTALKPQLMSLGMRAAFGDADFSGLTSGPVQIDDVIHQAVLKVFEGGTIAAAATAVTIRAVSAFLPQQTIVFDRPFLFAIVDQPTGEVLFLGRVLDPTAK